MSVAVQTLCQSYLLELHEGIHVWGADVMKLALYAPGTILNAETTNYSVLGEVAGVGYAAGGVALALTAGFPKIGISGKVLIDFADVAIACNGFTTRYGLIYNSSKANRTIAVIDFGIGLLVNISFNLVWPPNDDANAIIQLGAAQ